MTRLVEALRRVTGTRLTASHALRALMRVLAPRLAHLGTKPRQPLRLPSNAAGYGSERLRFEETLAALVTETLVGRVGESTNGSGELSAAPNVEAHRGPTTA